MLEQPNQYEAELDGFPFTPGELHQASRDPVERLLSEFVERQRRGDNPSVEAYARRYPQQAEQIRSLLPMVAAMEHWKSRKEAGILRQRLSHDFRIPRIGQRCRVVRELGRGGMGVVFEAEHETLRRRVAVKLLPWRFAQDSGFRRRFELEAQTASKLRHANIVRVLEFGEWDGFCYYVMPFVEGVGLDWIIERLRSQFGIVYADEVAALRCRQTGLPSPQRRPVGSSGRNADPGPGISPSGRSAPGVTRPAGRPAKPARSLRRDSWMQFAGIGLQVAEALRYAHAHGTVHRDIKPGNLLLDKNGRVWVTDFGLAQPLDGDREQEAGDLAGTLRYMAPERFAGHCDERCDVYGLGMSLYELVTLQAAVDEKDRAMLVQTVTRTDPLLPRTINREIPPDLETIIVNAIARKPENRYQTAGEMVGDLLRFINQQPLRARRPAGWKRLRDSYRRRRSNGLKDPPKNA